MDAYSALDHKYGKLQENYDELFSTAVLGTVREASGGGRDNNSSLKLGLAVAEQVILLVLICHARDQKAWTIVQAIFLYELQILQSKKHTTML